MVESRCSISCEPGIVVRQVPYPTLVLLADGYGLEALRVVELTTTVEEAECMGFKGYTQSLLPARPREIQYYGGVLGLGVMLYVVLELAFHVVDIEVVRQVIESDYFLHLLNIHTILDELTMVHGISDGGSTLQSLKLIELSVHLRGIDIDLSHPELIQLEMGGFRYSVLGYQGFLVGALISTLPTDVRCYILEVDLFTQGVLLLQ